MKRGSVVYVVTYNCDVFCVCSSFELAVSCIDKAVFDLGLVRDDFSVFDRSVIVAL